MHVQVRVQLHAAVRAAAAAGGVRGRAGRAGRAVCEAQRGGCEATEAVEPLATPAAAGGARGIVPSATQQIVPTSLE